MKERGINIEEIDEDIDINDDQSSEFFENQDEVKVKLDKYNGSPKGQMGLTGVKSPPSSKYSKDKVLSGVPSKENIDHQSSGKLSNMKGTISKKSSKMKLSKTDRTKTKNIEFNPIDSTAKNFHLTLR